MNILKYFDIGYTDFFFLRAVNPSGSDPKQGLLMIRV